MVPKSRLALIGVGILLVAAAAWLGRSLPAPAASQLPARAVAAGVSARAEEPSSGQVPAPVASPVATEAPAATRPLVFGLSGPVQLADVPAGPFQRQLVALAPGARDRALAQLGRLRVPLNDVASLRADRNGRLFYRCLPPTLAQRARAQAITAADSAQQTAAAKIPQAAAVPISSPPIRHSRPGASKVIYLDFNGHTITGTAWNEANGEPADEDYLAAVASYAAKPYDTDGDPATFSEVEQTAIIATWARMAEDYAPFEVDVTTQEPSSFNRHTGRVLFTPKTDGNGVALPYSGSAAGVAFLDAFGYSDYADYSPVFVFIDGFDGDGPGMAVTGSHEMGHNLGLSHDGTSSEEYYEGHDAGGVPSWGPLMGAPYGVAITQWSKGEYYDANNTEDDDLAIIAGALGYRADDHADSNGAATDLTVSGNALSGAGFIGTTGEADRFRFSAGAGLVQFDVAGRPLPDSYYGTDLDLALELYDAGGNLVAQADDTTSPIQSISATVGAGTYYLRVKPVGAGTPQAASPSGYTAYGSLGVYAITGSVAVPGAPPSATPDRPTLFDANAYLAANPDIAAGVGNGADRAQKAWEHYWKHGIAEGRTDGDFNVKAYLAQYPALAAQFGSNLQAAALHWYTVGRAQGLRIPTGFDVVAYLARHLDIYALFKNDKYGAWLHFFNYGLNEGRDFDANFVVDEYLELNPDIKAAFGTNRQAALLHWFQYGHPIEDRMGRVPIGFDVDKYLARYPDLAGVLGGITPRAVRNVTTWHQYLAYGVLESRSDGDFEANAYLASNPDLAAVYGTDVRGAALHWFFYGRREGRRIPALFDVHYYRTRYPDIVVIFGDDLYGSWLHYLDWGIAEGRVFDELFRPDEYIALNPDLAPLIGNDRELAVLHWLHFGKAAGRQGRY